MRKKVANIIGASVLLVSLLYGCGAAGGKTGVKTTTQTPEASPSVTIPQNTPPAEGYQKYTNETYKISLYYPPNWSFEENVMGSVVAFYSYQESENDVIFDNVNLIIEEVEDLPAEFAEYSQMLLDDINSFISGANVLSMSETTLSGKRAGKFVFTGTIDNMSLKFQQIWAIAGNKAYILTYTAEVNSYDKFLPEAEKIFSSIAIGE